MCTYFITPNRQFTILENKAQGERIRSLWTPQEVSRSSLFLTLHDISSSIQRYVQNFLCSRFLAKLFPQLCSCHWNGNYDLFSNFVTFLAPLWPFYDLFSNFMTFLWPLWPFYDLFSTFVTFLWTTKKVTILSTTKWYYLDLIVTFLWPFYESNCDLFMNNTI